jgi:uroporphyrin-3 C-methyltransferase
MNEEDQPITNSTSPTSTATSTSTATPPSAAEKPQEPSSRLPLRAVGLFVILAVVVAWQWYDTRSQIEGLQQELGRKLAEAGASGKESRNLASEAREAGRQAEGKLLLLEAKLAESQSQQLALEALYQEVARNRDEVTLEEVE